MKHETPEDRVKRLINGLLTPTEIALIEGRLFENGGELLLASRESDREIRYLPPAPSLPEQVERRKRAISRLSRRRGWRALILRIEEERISFAEINDEAETAAR